MSRSELWMVLAIHVVYMLTLTYTPGLLGRPQSDPQLTMPAWVQTPSMSQTRGPPESP